MVLATFAQTKSSSPAGARPGNIEKLLGHRRLKNNKEVFHLHQVLFEDLRMDSRLRGNDSDGKIE